MRLNRFSIAALAAGALIMAAGCKSTTRTTTTTETSEVATVPASTSTTYSTAEPMTSSSTVATTSTDQTGATTTTLSDGTKVTKAESTTVVYPDGRVEKLTGTASSSLTGSNGVPTVPPGAQVVTQTKMTMTTKPAEQTVSTAQIVPQPIYITTTPANIYAEPPGMTSSQTTIYRPAPAIRGRRFPGTNFLIFADRASFSSDNNSLSGTLNTGVLGTDIRHQDGWGLGFNTYLGRTNLSLEFTGSRIRPRATLTPANTNFNPITDLRIKMTPITGALQLHWNPRSSVDFYVGGGGAYVMMKPDNSFNAANTGLTSIRFRDEWGPLVNAGLGFGFSPNFGINFDAKYMWVRANARTTFGDETVIGNVGNSQRIGLNPFVLSAGLRFGF